MASPLSKNRHRKRQGPHVALPSLHFFTIPIIAGKSLHVVSTFFYRNLERNGFVEPFSKSAE
jgi:hypothetical protein